ncbi:hypothetical protein E8E13_008537 [Curvularia kusanoi]|uniref:Uncharacterized protein n=1 Tax=Curvularia kusanoi TaxID=90978 RepID=A0A9P4TD57_CURKU|nr:hypothetical protein E8E13_008537 [Curvularia kusanoi]
MDYKKQAGMAALLVPQPHQSLMNPQTLFAQWQREPSLSLSPHELPIHAPRSSTRTDNRAISATNSPTLCDQPPPAQPFPYLTLLSTHLTLLTSFGLIQASAPLTTPHQTLLSLSPTATSWLLSVPIFLAYTLAPLSPLLTPRYISYPNVLALGAGFHITGLLVASFGTGYGVLMLGQGVLVGLGHGMSFAPAVGRLTEAVKERAKWRTGVLGVAGCGAPVGGMVFAGVARGMDGRKGVLWIVCGVVAVVTVGVQVCVRWGVAGGAEGVCGRGQGDCCETQEHTVARRMQHVLRNRGLVHYTIAVFLFFAALWIPYFQLRAFAIDALGKDPADSFTVLMILNAAGIPGRIVPALVSDGALGVINTYILVLLLTSITLLLLPLVATKADMFAWAAAYGFSSGGAVSLVQAGVIELCEGGDHLRCGVGVVFGIAGIASLVGAPVSAELVGLGLKLFGSGSDSFFLLQMCTGGMMLMACVGLFVARTVKTGWCVARRV